MYDDYDLDYAYTHDYADLDEYYDLDEEYARDSQDLDALAYLHYAWYNILNTLRDTPMIAQKRHVRVTLDILCYDDLEVERLDWKGLLDLEGDEDVESSIRELDINCYK